MGHRDFFLNLKELLKFKKSLLGLGRWLSWCNAYLASMRTWVPSPGLIIKKEEEEAGMWHSCLESQHWGDEDRWGSPP